MPDYQIQAYRDIEVCWLRDLNGGGETFGQDFVPVVRRLFGPVERIFEFCAGPGFIGFSLLAEGLCRTLALADINPESVEALRATVARNGLQDRVDVYLSDGLDSIPRTESWDLVVGNPPHFSVEDEDTYLTNIRRFDPQWRIHSAFYKQVGHFLKPHGSVLLMENYAGSDEATFAAALQAGDLELVQSLMYGPEPGRENFMYFMWSRHADPRLITSAQPIEQISVKASQIASISYAAPIWRRVQLHIENDTAESAMFWLGDRQSTPPRQLKIAPGDIKSSPILIVPPGALMLTRNARLAAMLNTTAQVY